MTKNDPNKELSLIEENISNGNLKLAVKQIELFIPQEQHQMRVIEHLKAKILLMKGQYKDCVNLISDIENEFGFHIGLAADKSCALYMMEDYLRWKESVKVLNSQLEEAKSEISYKTYIKTAICLAKFKEELGEIYEALQIYKELIGSLNKLVDDYPMVLAQIVRLKSKWQESSDLVEQYGDLNAINEQRYNENFNIELNYSLFIAEMEIIDTYLAIKRYEKIKNKLDKEDQILFLSELVEHSLRKDIEIPTNIFKEYSSLEKFSYDECLYKIYTNEDLNIPSMTLYSILTIHYLLILKNDKHKASLLKRFHLLIQGLSSKTKKMWLSKIETNSEVNIMLNNTEISFDGAKLNLAKKKIALNIIRALTGRSKISLEELTKEIWDAEYNESYYHRIRVAVTRTNKTISSALFISDLFRIDTTNLYLSKGISIIE